MKILTVSPLVIFEIELLAYSTNEYYTKVFAPISGWIIRQFFVDSILLFIVR